NAGMAGDGADQDVDAGAHRDSRAVQHQQAQPEAPPQRDSAFGRRITRHQCEYRIGSGGFDSRLLVAPPRTNSRKRECPYAPMTSRSAAWEATYAWRPSAIGLPLASTLSSTTSIPCRDRFFDSSSAECLVSRSFSLRTVTTRTCFAFSSSGSASDTARAAARLKSQATATVPSSNGRDRGLCGRIRVGLPDPNITASAYHRSFDSGMIVRSRSRAYSTKRSGTSNVLHF